jgi:two-component system, cell cycle response regulator DivK
MNEIISPTSANIMNAYNGKEAMQLFQENKINLVLLDIRLPDTDGLTIARKMKILKPDIPIIAQTAYATDIDTKACMDAGCNAYVSKPINTEKLFGLIQDLLK